MIINITHKTTIRNIQQKLRIAYPFLKIEFSKKSHEEENNIRFVPCYADNIRALDIAKKAQPGWIILHSWYKSSYIKKIFEDRFGLYANIFRREDEQWNKATATDIFTIEEQNELGRRSVEKVHAHSSRERELLL